MNQHSESVLCAQCSRIDFKAAFSVLVPDRNGSAVTGLLKLSKDQCGFCEMVKNMLDMGNVLRHEYEEQGFHLRAFQALTALKLVPSRVWKNTVFDTVLVVILGRPDKTVVRDVVRMEGLFLGSIVPLAANSMEMGRHLVYRGVVVAKQTIDYPLLRSWIVDCEISNKRSHDECHNITTAQAPRIRVIDTFTRHIIPLPQVENESARYLCLSYVWGRPRIKAYGPIQRSGVPIHLPSKAPRTIEDAITVVKSLNERYLWVDQYCIADLEHKDEDIRQMDTIYSSAVATIVAVEGEDYHAGLTGVSTNFRLQQPQCLTNVGTVVSTLPPISHYVARSKWHQRGWTYQETYLSRRCLFFTASQVYFACPSQVRCEAVMSCFMENGRASGNRRVSNDRLNPDLFSVAYQKRMNRYDTSRPRNICMDIMSFNERVLTYPEDAFDAIKGILARSDRRSYWGVPLIRDTRPSASQGERNTETTSFILGLSWYLDHSQNHHNPVPAERRYGFPSWSWLSIGGVTKFAQHKTIMESNPRIAERPRSNTVITTRIAASDNDDDDASEVSFEDLSTLSSSSLIIPEQSPYISITSMVIRLLFSIEIKPDGSIEPHSEILCPDHKGGVNPQIPARYTSVRTSDFVELHWDLPGTFQGPSGRHEKDQRLQYYGIQLFEDSSISEVSWWMIYAEREEESFAERVGLIQLQNRHGDVHRFKYGGCGCSITGERKTVKLR